MSAMLLVRALRDPASLGPDTDWTGLISAARANCSCASGHFF